MLTPKYLEDAPEDVVKYFVDLEEKILCDIARRIKGNHLNMTSTAQYQIDKLEELGLLRAEVNSELAKLLNTTDVRIEDIIKQSSYKSVQDDNEIFKEAYNEGKIPKFNPNYPSLTSFILDGIKGTKGEIRNVCNSMASASNKAYSDALDKAYLSVSSGAFSYADAVKTAVNELGKKGLQWIDYESGAHRRPDSAIRNALRTGISQTASRCQDKNFEDMGGNLVEVTSHIGARPNHAIWQGGIYWKSYEVEGYKGLKEATGYGKGPGLCGWGCRHSYFPYFEGLSSKSFEKYDEQENLEEYNLQQEQRYNERAIREWKRRMNVNQAGGVEYSKERRKVREWNARQKELLEAHPELKRNYARERPIAANRIEVAKRKDDFLLKGYEAAVKKGDISSFITPQIYKQEAAELDKELLGLKIKGGIIVSGYKTHFLDRKIGQYEDSNEPMKNMRQGVSLENILNCLMHPVEIRKKSEIDWNYISDNCKITYNPKTKTLVQVNPKKRKKVKP